MLNTTITPLHILFNPFKHHLGALQQMLQQVALADLPAALKKIGASQMDMYTGILTPEEIFGEIITGLAKSGIYKADDYTAFLVEQGDFIKMGLTDHSQWILRLSDHPSQFIHLHPGRYSPHSLRIKAAALKTAMAFKRARQEGQLKGEMLININQVRKFTGLSPVRKLADIRHILRILELMGCKVSEEI